MTVRIDLNADLGESFGTWVLGDDEAMLDVVTSANVACGFHAGDATTIRRTVAAAAERGVVVGAQVGYRDLAGFGRRRIDMDPADLTADVLYQLGALEAMCRVAGTRVAYVKPHGALYTTAAVDEVQARAVVDAVAAYDRALPLLGLPGSVLLRVAQGEGLTTVAEAFADRGYAATGHLVPQVQPGGAPHRPRRRRRAGRPARDRRHRPGRGRDGLGGPGPVRLHARGHAGCRRARPRGARGPRGGRGHDRTVRRALAVSTAPYRSPGGGDAGGGDAGGGPAGGVPLTLLPAGEDALLVEVAGLDEVLALDASLRRVVAAGEAPWSAVTDVVPAARTVLLLARPGTDLGALGQAVRDLAARVTLPASGPGPSSTGGEVVEVPVTYDGPDLDDVARLTGLTPGEVVSAHTATPWRVAFGGFAPGFAYLVGGDPVLRVPRRDHPRPSVPAGAVGLAGEFSGVYPRPSPGGWQLLGTTTLTLWDVDRDPPALLTPGTTVRFVDIGGSR